MARMPCPPWRFERRVAPGPTLHCEAAHTVRAHLGPIRNQGESPRSSRAHEVDNPSRGEQSGGDKTQGTARGREKSRDPEGGPGEQ
jgi:hypothetical protein